MSRIGKNPIPIPQGVEVSIARQKVSVKGTKGSLSRVIPREIAVDVKENTVFCTPAEESKRARAMWGLSRMLIYNMIVGVSTGFSKELEIIGVGYKAELKGKDLVISAGYSHPVVVTPPEGISFGLDSPTKIKVMGMDKEQVGQIAANIRGIRPPEPYKGKGIRYAGEVVHRKAGKSGTK